MQICSSWFVVLNLLFQQIWFFMVDISIFVHNTLSLSLLHTHTHAYSPTYIHAYFIYTQTTCRSSAMATSQCSVPESMWIENKHLLSAKLTQFVLRGAKDAQRALCEWWMCLNSLFWCENIGKQAFRRTSLWPGRYISLLLSENSFPFVLVEMLG